jgi:carbon monoxide dehydrogenase subunit G
VNLQNSGEEKIPVGPDTVWTFVTDPEKVGRCFPELVDVTVQDSTHLEAVVKVGVGPVRGKFKLKVELLPAPSKRRIDMKRSGGGFGSTVDLTAGADLVDAGDGTTLLKWSGQAEARRPDCRRRRTRARRAGPEADRTGVWQRPTAVVDLRATLRA